MQGPDVVALEAMHLEAEVLGMLHTEELGVSKLFRGRAARYGNAKKEENY